MLSKGSDITLSVAELLHLVNDDVQENIRRCLITREVQEAGVVWHLSKLFRMNPKDNLGEIDT